MTIRVLIASYNRAQKTRACLDALRVAMAQVAMDFRVYLFDDGSSDNTIAVARDTGLPITVLHGDGSFFWARSMATAEAAAMADSSPGDAILWLNDDVVLDQDSIMRLTATSGTQHAECLVIGATRDPLSGELTYSGFSKRGWHPLSFEVILPRADAPVPATTFNGNIVLVPFRAALAIGGIDGKFAHGLADIDYGLRAREAGWPVLLATGTLGTCPRNPPDPRPLLEEWRAFRGIKGGGHVKSTSRFMDKHAARKRRIALWLTPIKWWATALIRHLKRRIDK